MNCRRFRSCLRFLFVALLAVPLVRLCAADASPAHRIPVILQTDIGTDIDDTWALAYLLRCPELDLKLVLTDTGDTRYRAKIAARLLEAAGRTDVPVAVGHMGTMGAAERNLDSWVSDYDLAKYPGKVFDDGIGALIDLVMHSSEPVTIIALGPVPSLALAVQREPAIAARCRFVGMHGSFDLGYGDRPPASAESNVKVDPAALRTVLSVRWRDVLLTPLDTCGSVQLGGSDYRRVWCDIDDPLIRAVIESYCVFAPRVSWMKCDFFTQHSTTLFDCVAVYLAYAEDLVTTERVRFEITDGGFTRRGSGAASVSARVALHWKDRAAFEHLLAGRLVSPTGRSPSR